MSDNFNTPEAQRKPPKYDLGQRTAANKQLENKINTSGVPGIYAETWTVQTPNPGTGVSIYDSKGGSQYAVVTIDGQGYVRLRKLLKAATFAQKSAIAELTGVEPDDKTVRVESFKAPGVSFDMSFLGK